MNKIRPGFLMAALLAGTAAADTRLSTRYDFYDIAPTSRHELVSELRSHSPVIEQGHVFIGHTDWKLYLNYHHSEHGGECRVSSANISVVVVYTLPRLDNSYFYDWATESSFDRYYQALLAHEQGHGEHGLQAARELQLALGELHARNCAALATSVDAHFNATLAKYRQHDIDYDQRTGHGRLQGADLDQLL